MTYLEVLFTPADFAALNRRDLSETVCVVFDVLRATSTIVTALGNGAEAIIPVADIPEALAVRKLRPDVLLAGERDGVRIPASLTGSFGFEVGNSPREFAPAIVRGRTVVMTTTNGTRALRACANARTVLACCFLNLEATATYIARRIPKELLVICSGTQEETAYEDALGAGALCDLVWRHYANGRVADSALMAVHLFRLAQTDLVAAMSGSNNGKRLLARAELKDDVAFCAERDGVNLVAEMGKDGLLRRQ